MRATLVCVLIGVLCALVLVGPQATLWGQVPLRRFYDDPLAIGTYGLWANAVALVAVSVGFPLMLNGRRSSVGFLISAAGLVVMAFGPSPLVAKGALVVAGAGAVAIGFIRGEAARHVDIDPGTTQNIIGGTYTVAMPLLNAGFAWAAGGLGLASYLVAAGLLAAAFAITLRQFRDSPVPATSSVGRRVRERWTRRSIWGFVLVLFAASGFGAVFVSLPRVLDTHGYRGSGWLLAFSAAQLVAGLLVLVVWAPLSARLADRGLRVMVPVMAVGASVLAGAATGKFPAYVTVEWLGLLVFHIGWLGTANALQATVGRGPKAAVIVAAIPFGMFIGGGLADAAISAAMVWMSPGTVALGFALVSLLGALAYAPVLLGRDGQGAESYRGLVADGRRR
ncbi:hypothetical protein [Baekduia alba]|uniref:hypothetical protein n=1 Tax=Baekduia alba TaxID=2997333 RepID=UPI002341C163|nr:hypothetical protein [Baekduia alba]